MNIIEKFQEHCAARNIQFDIVDNVKPYNDSTLFCPAGMQQFKAEFKNLEYKSTIANIQPCIRMNDFQEIGDGSHFLYFNMIGLFSFREMDIKQAIKFWIDFLNNIGVQPDYVTIHSDCAKWADYYKELGIENIVQDDENCTWSDGEIGGYCTEFFKNGIEIGNIVNPLGDCIDAGFGLERLEILVNNKNNSKIEILQQTAMKIIDGGYKPSNVKQGYVLRKIMREIYKLGSNLEHPYFSHEIERQRKIIKRYNRLKEQHKDKSKEWWYDTHGVDLDELDESNLIMKNFAKNFIGEMKDLDGEIVQMVNKNLIEDLIEDSKKVEIPKNLEKKEFLSLTTASLKIGLSLNEVLEKYKPYKPSDIKDYIDSNGITTDLKFYVTEGNFLMGMCVLEFKNNILKRIQTDNLK